MDPLVAYRHRIGARVVRRLALSAGVSTLIALAAGLATGLDPWLVAPWSVLVGQAVATLWALAVIGRGPLSVRRLSADLPLRYHPVPFEPDRRHDDATAHRAIVETMAAVGLRPVASMGARADEEPVYDLYQSANRLVTAMVGRRSGDPCLVTRLADGRLAVTGRLRIGPHPRLVFRTVRNGPVPELARRHRDLLEELAAAGSHPQPSRPGVAVQLARLEADAWARLGPWRGSFVEPAGRDDWWSLRVPAPDDPVWPAVPEKFGPVPQASSARADDLLASAPSSTG